MSLNIGNQPNFSGVIVEIYDGSILVLVNEAEDEFKVGSRVHVFYDGTIAESYPAQINIVYTIIMLDQ
jgi:hypothetical protein